MKVLKQLIPQTKFVLALSGGYDSLSTAILLKNKFDSDFVAVHFNGHFIEQDDLAESKVREFCKVNSIPLIVKSGENNYVSGSKEDYCRKARYAAIGEACNSIGVNIVLTGHNLNDCVTSYLWNTFRGHPNFNPIPFVTDFVKFYIHRPFLLSSKDEMKFVAKKFFPDIDKFVTEDELNKDVSLTRNWIRDVVIPIIHEKPHFNLNTVVKKIVESKFEGFLEQQSY